MTEVERGTKIEIKRAEKGWVEAVGGTAKEG